MKKTVKKLSKHLRLENTYTFSYIHNGDFENAWNIDFSAKQIKAVLHSLPHYDICCEHHLKVMLKEMIEIWGRTLLGKPLSKAHSKKEIKFVNCAIRGCEDCTPTLEFHLAAYLALHLDEIIEDGEQIGAAGNKSTFFFIDCDGSETNDILISNLAVASSKPSAQIHSL